MIYTTTINIYIPLQNRLVPVIITLYMTRHHIILGICYYNQVQQTTHPNDDVDTNTCGAL